MQYNTKRRYFLLCEASLKEVFSDKTVKNSRIKCDCRRIPMTKRPKFMILDGNSLIYRAFYAIPILTTSEGQFTNGVFGFVNMLMKIL
ncbi:MAG TPA: hypothetical protein VNT57_06405, partial [Desulfobacteria bacterium]|nr:hypothetical protein [Desulfobacteria bacterium]